LSDFINSTGSLYDVPPYSVIYIIIYTVILHIGFTINILTIIYNKFITPYYKKRRPH